MLVTAPPTTDINKVLKMADDKQVKAFFGGGAVAKRIEKAKKLRAGVHKEKAKKGSEFPFLGTKNGDPQFTYGQDSAPVPDGTLFAVNIMTADVGWAYWHNRKKTAVMESIWADDPVLAEELDDISHLRDSQGKEIKWGPAYAWQLVAINGPMKGVTVAYEGTANYMLDISEQLIQLTASRMEESEACFPIIGLWNDPYPNADNGNPTSKHKFDLYAWGTVDGEVDEEIKEFPECGPKKTAPAKKRTRRRAA